MKVVIADDEPLARERLRTLLAAQPGVELVAEVGDGHAALHAVAEHDADLVLLDIAMPGIDGLEAARHLSAFEPRPAVVFCTAYDAHALSAFEAAAVDYLVKPVRPERLQAALEREREEAERERVRAEKRAANPDGITENTSKKKLQQKHRAEEEAARAAAAKEYAAKKGILEDVPAEEKQALSGIAERPYCKGRAYDPDRYNSSEE